MGTAVTVLALAGLLQAVQFVLMAVPVNRELGTGYTTSPRDTAPEDALSPRSDRLRRALANHFEGLILFTLAVVVVTLSGSESWLTGVCAWVYLGARILYVPAYAFGWSPWRSFIWAAGFAATVLMILAALV